MEDNRYALEQIKRIIESLDKLFNLVVDKVTKEEGGD